MKETPSQLPIQSYLMNFPFTFSTNNPNNVWMKEMSEEECNRYEQKSVKLNYNSMTPSMRKLLSAEATVLNLLKRTGSRLPI